MNKLYISLLVLFSVVSQSQSRFSPGYYIDQNNIKHEGFIEDSNPYNNPEKIFFKSSLDENESEILIDYIKEFKIDADYRYVKFNVDYDTEQVVNKSETYIYGKEPKLQKKSVLLKVLVEGEFTLYKAIIDDFIFFFIKNVSEETPKLLIHRKYNLDNSIKENNDFRKQLYDDMKSETLEIGDFLKLVYEERELTTVFIKVNSKNNSLVEQSLNLEKYKNKFYYKIFAGATASFGSYALFNIRLKNDNVSFANPILGLEFSNVLSVNAERSEIFGRIFYQKINSESSFLDNSFTGYATEYNLNIDLNTISISVGYRHNLSKNLKSKLFFDGSFGVLKVLSSSDLTFSQARTYVQPNQNSDYTELSIFKEFSYKFFINFGIGYTFNKKYSVNIEYSLPKNYLNRYSSFSGGISNINLFFTYTLNK